MDSSEADGHMIAAERAAETARAAIRRGDWHAAIDELGEVLAEANNALALCEVGAAIDG